MFSSRQLVRSLPLLRFDPYSVFKQVIMLAYRSSAVIITVIAIHFVSIVSTGNPVKWIQSNLIKTIGKFQLIRLALLGLISSDLTEFTEGFGQPKKQASYPAPQVILPSYPHENGQSNIHGHQSVPVIELAIPRRVARIPRNNLPIPVPGKDLPDDSCGDTATRFPNGVCHALLRQGPCQDPYDWVTLNPRTFEVRIVQFND